MHPEFAIRHTGATSGRMAWLGARVALMDGANAPPILLGVKQEDRSSPLHWTQQREALDVQRSRASANRLPCTVWYSAKYEGSPCALSSAPTECVACDTVGPMMSLRMFTLSRPYRAATSLLQILRDATTKVR